ncbi:TFIIB-type zinc ribbon-containing protein [Natrinema salinisoli]|uniref:TFIIB-type zinc ribbon-containing protein n=1 Tax=Natrinema salinisoli TaxID=2878535 RepID=UPI001CF0998D|nr:TFIIB-type zinc ribbon-containing protein [Natrinema salinisoli]
MAIRTYHDDSQPPPERGTHDSHPPSERRKTVLFCPECGHESPITDDWETMTADGDRLLVCTDCGSVVDRRSRRHSELVEAT